MLLFLGQGVSIHASDLLTLTDLQRPLSSDTADLLNRLRQSGDVRSLGAKPKTLVLCREGEKTVCYLSCVGLRTLRNRMESEPFKKHV